MQDMVGYPDCTGLQFYNKLAFTRVANAYLDTYICFMNTKLTLTIEKEIIEITKVYAKEKGQSLSEMVENYFKLLTMDRRPIDQKELSPRVNKLRGIIKSNEFIDPKQVLEEELARKHGA